MYVKSLLSLKEKITCERNYQRYCRFIQTRKPPIKGQLIEKHHVLPRSYGGLDEDNVIMLTLKEHYIAHLLLWKACGGKMSTAFYLMTHTREGCAVKSAKVYAMVKEEHIRECSERVSGKNNPNYGKTHSAETRAKISQSNTGKSRSKEAIDATAKANRGKKRTAETKAKISEANKDRPCSEQTKEKISKTLLGENNYWRGRKQSEDHIRKRTMSQKGSRLSEETKKKISDSKKGKVGGKNNPRARSISINDVMYDTVKEAAMLFKMNTTTVRKRCLSDEWEAWYYVDEK